MSLKSSRPSRAKDETICYFGFKGLIMSSLVRVENNVPLTCPHCVVL